MDIATERSGAALQEADEDMAVEDPLITKDLIAQHNLTDDSSGNIIEALGDAAEGNDA